MKLKFVTLFFLSVLMQATSCKSGESDRPGNSGGVVSKDAIPVIQFDTTENNFGTISEGEQIIIWFDYTNTGEAPLIINNIVAGCGCTVPRWKGEPLNPGGKESIRVVFNSDGKSGVQNIPVKVYSNASDDVTILHIKGVVHRKY